MSALLIVVNHDAVAALLKSPEIMADLTDRGTKIASAAGDGVEIEPFVGKARARVTVRTATIPAMVAEATDRTLTRAIDAGR